jgi:acetoin:2,6-dichlorophenolindophenol oxidoreductase subunit alpha
MAEPELAGSTAGSRASDSLSPTRLRELYRLMLLIRRFDERCLELLASKDIHGGVHPYFGQEAIAVGVCAALTKRDRIASTHRGHGHTIAKGARIDRMMAELHGRVDGYCRGMGGSMHIADFEIGMLGANGVVGAGLPITAGSALAAMLQGTGEVSVCFFGDGAIGGGPFHEVLNIAALWALPMVLVCENNGWAVGNTPEQTLAARSIASYAEPYDMAHLTLDGNDVLAMYDGATSAVEAARAGRGPTLIEARTYRMGVHVVSPRVRVPAVFVPDDRETHARWAARDPISLLAGQLRAREIVTERDLVDVEESVRDEIDAAIRFAQASPYPAPDSALSILFAEDR